MRAYVYCRQTSKKNNKKQNEKTKHTMTTRYLALDTISQ